MKNVKGGQPAPCQVGASCSFYDAGFIPHNGQCDDSDGGCNCVADGMVVSSPACGNV